MKDRRETLTDLFALAEREGFDPAALLALAALAEPEAASPEGEDEQTAQESLPQHFYPH